MEHLSLWTVAGRVVEPILFPSLVIVIDTVSIDLLIGIYLVNTSLFSIELAVKIYTIILFIL